MLDSLNFEGRAKQPCLLLVDRPVFASWIRSVEDSIKKGAAGA